MSSSQFDLKLLMQVVGFDEAKAAMDKLGASTDTLVASQQKAGTASESMGQKITKQKTSVLGLSSSFGTIITSSWSLYNAWDSLEKVQLASDKANTKVKSSQIALVNAQDKLTAAIAKYGAGSKEAAQAQDVVVKATEQLANAQETAAIRAGDVTEANAQFLTTLPIMVTGILSSVTAFGSMAKGMEGIHRDSPLVVTAVKGISIAFDFITAHPIILVLTAVAAVFVLLATNAFGFRDAVNALGKAIGDMFPFLKETLELIGGAANWFLDLINPVNQTGTAFGEMGTSATGMGTAVEETQAQVEGLGGVLIDQNTVIGDVIAQHQALITQQTANQTAYEAWKTAITTGNTELVDSYNLTADDIAKFEDQYAKEMEDSQKAAEDAAKAAYDAWKKSIEDSRKEVEGGFGVLQSSFSKISSGIASALDEGGKAFKKYLKETGLDPLNPLVLKAILEWSMDTTPAESGITGFGLYVAQNIESLKNGTAQTFSSMVSQWVDYISEEEPKAGAAAAQWGTTMTTSMKAKIDAGEPPAQAFLESIRETLDPTIAEQIASLFGIKFPEGTEAEFKKGTPAVATAATGMTDAVKEKMDPTIAEGFGTIFGKGVTGKTVEELDAGKPKVETSATNMTTGINTKLTAGMNTIKTNMTTKVQDAIIKPVQDIKPKIESETPVIVSAFTELGKSIGTAWDETVKYLTDAWNGFLKLIGGGIPEVQAEEQKGSFLDTATSNFQNIMKKKPVTTTTAGGGADTEAMKAQTTAATALNTALGTLSTTVGTLTPKLTALSTAFTTLGTAFTTLGTTVTTATTTMNTQIGVFVTTTTTQFTAVTAKLTALGLSFTTLSTTITTAMTTANTQIGVFVTTTGTQFTTLSTTVTTAITAMNTQIGMFATNTGTQFTAVGTKATALGATFTAFSTTATAAVTKVNTQVGVMATTISTQTAAMTTKINSFASAMDSAMKKITTSMNTAKTAADNLKKSIDALKDKTITITTRYVTSGSPAGQHGYTGIVNAPGNVGGVRTGEGFRPELITVTPLTRGTGNHTGMTMGGGLGSPGGRGSGGEVVNNITVVLDGRVIQKFVEKTALAGLGSQI